jgi:hypothetical protein
VVEVEVKVEVGGGRLERARWKSFYGDGARDGDLTLTSFTITSYVSLLARYISASPFASLGDSFTRERGYFHHVALTSLQVLPKKTTLKAPGIQ